LVELKSEVLVAWEAVALVVVVVAVVPLVPDLV
jgi:hypothetical protein